MDEIKPIPRYFTLFKRFFIAITISNSKPRGWEYSRVKDNTKVWNYFSISKVTDDKNIAYELICGPLFIFIAKLRQP